jgi:hypothetical protein
MSDKMRIVNVEYADLNLLTHQLIPSGFDINLFQISRRRL